MICFDFWFIWLFLITLNQMRLSGSMAGLKTCISQSRASAEVESYWVGHFETRILGAEWLLCLSYLEESEQQSVLSVWLIIRCLPTHTFEIVMLVSVEGRNDLTEDNNQIVAVCHWLCVVPEAGRRWRNPHSSHWSIDNDGRSHRWREGGGSDHTAHYGDNLNLTAVTAVTRATSYLQLW